MRELIHQNQVGRPYALSAAFIRLAFLRAFLAMKKAEEIIKV